MASEALKYLGVVIPSAATYEKYGLTVFAFLDLVDRQGGVCAVCENCPSTGRLCIDHFHAPKYKKLPAEARASHVRGLLCFWCNSRHMGRGVTARKLRNGVDYLEAHEARLASL